MFEQIKKNWQDWKDGAEERERLSLIRKRAYRISQIREDRIQREKDARGIIQCGRCGYEHHREASCEEAIAYHARARLEKLSDENGIIHCRRCGYDHHYTAACEEAIAYNEGIPLSEMLARTRQRSTAQRAQQSFISSIIFGVWK